MLFAKNSDRPKDEFQPLELRQRRSHSPSSEAKCLFLTIPQVETTWRHVGSRPVWCWGYEHGFNEHQVVIGNEALHSKLVPGEESRLIGMDLVRLGLERGRTAEEATDVITSLISEYGQGSFGEHGDLLYDNGFIVADPKEAFVIETAGYEWVVKRVRSPLGISNVYSVGTDYESISNSAETLATQKGWWRRGEPFNFANAYTRDSLDTGSGAKRRSRSCALLNNHSGNISLDTIMSVLRDHSDASTPDEGFQIDINHSTGICFHYQLDNAGQAKHGNTAARLILASIANAHAAALA